MNPAVQRPSLDMLVTVRFSIGMRQPVRHGLLDWLECHAIDRDGWSGQYTQMEGDSSDCAPLRQSCFVFAWLLNEGREKGKSSLVGATLANRRIMPTAKMLMKSAKLLISMKLHSTRTKASSVLTPAASPESIASAPDPTLLSMSISPESSTWASGFPCRNQGREVTAIQSRAAYEENPAASLRRTG